MRLGFATTLCLAVLTTAAAATAGELKAYDTPSYVIHTDLDEASEKEAGLRLTRMAEAYRERTQDFAGTIDHKLPFYLFASQQEYVNAGGLSGTAGLFVPTDGGKLLAFVANGHPTMATWHTVQHEGFHQFAHAVIGGELPPWLNEGLAEYFGEGIFTGDGFITGIVPPWRLARLKREIEARQLLPFQQMMALTPPQWNKRVTVADYDQAWSMVHFLVHGDGGKYQPPLAECIRALSRGRGFEQAWLETLGPADGFEPRWRAYWLGQPAEPTRALYNRAIVSILTSFLARATAQGQAFRSFDAFAAAARQNLLKMNADDWLPPALLSDALEASRTLGRWQITATGRGQPVLRLLSPNNGTFTGSFELMDGRVRKVAVQSTMDQ
jgi:hypothetical protein